MRDPYSRWEPVEAETAICPECGGDMYLSEWDGRFHCGCCEHTEAA